MRVFHRTSRAAADDILAHGFRDGAIGRHWAPVQRGVWIAAPPTTSDLGPGKETCLLAIDVDEAAIADYEVIEYDPDTGERAGWWPQLREWIVQADVLNGWPVRIVDEDDA